MNTYINVVKYLAWAWLLIIGGLLITPGGISCIVCGMPTVITLLGLVSLTLGILGLITLLPPIYRKMELPL